MINKSQIQTYINNFRRHIAPFLRPGIGLRCNVHQAISGGAILVFQVGSIVENDDVYESPKPTIGNALSTIKQRAFGGNLEGFTFSGTNVILEQNNIILIKDSSDSQWTDSAAEQDVQSVLPPHKRGQQ